MEISVACRNYNNVQQEQSVMFPLWPIICQIFSLIKLRWSLLLMCLKYFAWIEISSHLGLFSTKYNSSLIHALKYIKYINETYQIYSTTRMLLQSLPDAACSFSTPSAPYQVWTTGNIQIFFSVIIIITAYIERKHTSKGWSKVYIRTVVRISHYQQWLPTMSTLASIDLFIFDTDVLSTLQLKSTDN